MMHRGSDGYKPQEEMRINMDLSERTLKLMTLQNRAITIAKLATAMAKSGTVAQCYEAQHYIELIVQDNSEFFDQYSQEELGFVGDTRTFPPIADIEARAR